MLYRLMQTCLVTGSVALTATGCVPAPEAAGALETRASPIERSFPAGGDVGLRLSAGDYSIVGSAEPRLAIKWETRDPADATKVRIGVRVDGTNATIDTSGPSNGFRVAILMPARTHVAVWLTAGDLTLDAIEGNLDVSAWAGDVTIGVADPSRYRSVRASVTAGEISGPPFELSKGGVFRSASWTGPGQYSIRARLTAGNLAIRSRAHVPAGE